MNLAEALASLDPQNDEHWTGDGLPRVDVVSEGLDEPTSRKEITEAAPEFTRASVLEAQAEAAQREADAAASNDAPKAGDDGGDPPETPNEAPEGDGQAPTGEFDIPGIEPESDEYIECCEEVAAAEEALNKAVEKRDAATAAVIKAQDELSTLRDKQLRLQPADDNQQSIMRYIQANNNRRMRDGLAAQAVKDSGIDKLVGTVKSRLDQAMSQRKPARGSQRPPARQTGG